MPIFKDDVQSVLCTLESLFLLFVLIHVRHHKMSTFCNYLHDVNSKFQYNSIMDAKQSRLYALFFIILKLRSCKNQ